MRKPRQQQATRPKGATRAKAGHPEAKGIALYHDMRVEEDFAKCANRLFLVLKQAAAASPGAPRYLYLDVQGHRNAEGGFDGDAFEIMQDFLLGFLLPYLTEVHTPLLGVRNSQPQREDLPAVLHIQDPGRGHAYDHGELGSRNRDHRPDRRRTRPPVRAIADYLGLDEPVCLICWQTPVERAHVVPQALGGSNDVRNFALLCPRHHREAPDVADAEAFWSWVDYACDRDGHMKWEGADPELLAQAERVGIHLNTTGPVRRSVHHFDRVRDELVRHYGWSPEDLAGGAQWSALMKEFHTVLEKATSTHFNVAKKASTEAWAFEVARRRLKDGTAEEPVADGNGPARSAAPASMLAERTVRTAPHNEDAPRLMDAARRAESAIRAADLVREIVASEAVSSAEDVLRCLTEEVANRSAQLSRLSDELMEYAACRHCGRQIVRVGDAAWRHNSGVSMSRGCRAAGFDRDGSWDDSLDRSWKASPPRRAR
jgi:hypothetical protein